MTERTSTTEHEPQADVEDSAIAFARRLLGRPTVSVTWGGRTRLLVADDGAIQRFRRSLRAPAFRWSARAYRLLLAARAAAVPTRRAPTLGDAITTSLPSTLSRLRPTSVIIGTPGPAQSLVMYVADEQGPTTAVAKVAVLPSGDEAIAREIAALQDPAIDGRAPRLMHEGAVEGRAAFISSFESGRPGSTGDAGLTQAGRVLPAPGPRAQSYPIDEHPWVVRVSEVAGLDIEAIRRLVPEPVPTVRTHGDMAPWNLVVRRDRAIIAIDWESSEPDGLPGTDLAHHLMATMRFIRRASPQATVAKAIDSLVRDASFDEGRAIATTALAVAGTLLRERGAVDTSTSTFGDDALAVAAKRVEAAASTR